MGEESPQSSRGVENIGDKESKGLACSAIMRMLWQFNILKVS